MWRKEEVTYRIVDSFGVISTRTDRNGNEWSKEVNIVAWNNNPPKVDIREWDSDHSKCGKGITLTFDEAEKVADALNHIIAERGE